MILYNLRDVLYIKASEKCAEKQKNNIYITNRDLLSNQRAQLEFYLTICVCLVLHHLFSHFKNHFFILFQVLISKFFNYNSNTDRFSQRKLPIYKKNTNTHKQITVYLLDPKNLI
jgi:hypothetical protein